MKIKDGFTAVGLADLKYSAVSFIFSPDCSETEYWAKLIAAATPIKGAPNKKIFV